MEAVISNAVNQTTEPTAQTSATEVPQIKRDEDGTIVGHHFLDVEKLEW